MAGLSTYKSYKSKVSLPLCIKDIFWSSDSSKSTIFRDLSNDKCLHNYAQNQNNMSLNNLIWRGAPKTIFVSKDIIEMGEKQAKVHGTAVTIKWIDKEREKEGGESYSTGTF